VPWAMARETLSLIGQFAPGESNANVNPMFVSLY
jgi:hypothetical protein